MGKRKYSYLVYNDGKKEKILNWFYADSGIKNRKIVIFTQNGTYLYIQDKRLLPSYEPILVELSYHVPVLKSHHAFYKLRGGVHNIDVYDSNIWYAKDDVDRLEIIMN